MSQNELYHFGIPGMKWGHRKNKNNYHSTGVRSFIARKQNEKVDKSFKNWNENAQKKQDAIELGKKRNISKIAYENNKTNKNLKKQYKEDNKAYKKALRSNTTYRKGNIKKEVGSDISRKYLSEARKVKKQINLDPSNKELQKKYNQLMSKHDIERANARKAPQVAANRSARKASIKRAMTMTMKAAAASAVVAGGMYAANKYLQNHDVKINGQNIRISNQDVARIDKLINSVKNIRKYF